MTENYSDKTVLVVDDDADFLDQQRAGIKADARLAKPVQFEQWRREIDRLLRE